MRTLTALATAALALGTARVARTAAEQAATAEHGDTPFAPSPRSAPFVTLGYREAAADLLFVRLRGYFGGDDNTADGIAALCDAIAAVDPHFHRTYEYCANAMTLARRGVTQATYLHAIALLERGMQEYPHEWRFPNLAGQIYTQDLTTKDPAQRRAWDEKGTLLVESSIRMPGAPASAAEWAAVMRTKLGEHERAVEGLKEVLLLTTDNHAREALIARLAKLEHADAEELAAEMYEARHAFEAAWKAARPTLPPDWYVLLGPRLVPGFDMTDLATGGLDLVTTETVERLDPVE